MSITKKVQKVQKVLLTLGVMLLGVVVYNITNAANELQFSGYVSKIQPNTVPSETGTFNSYCYYPVQIWTHSSGYKVMSTDAKFFYSGLGLTGYQTGDAYPNYYSFASGYYWAGTGISQVADGSYPSNTPYAYVNAYVDLNNQTGSVITGEMLARVFFRNIVDIASGELSFYFINGTGEDSNIQSGGINKYNNIVTSVVDFGGLSFVKRPCILDQEAPRFTGYDSGVVLNYFTSAFMFTIYDWTGAYDIPQLYNTAVTNSTVHYFFSGSSYVPAPSDIDNQMGVRSGCVEMYVSGTTHNGFQGSGVFSGTTLLTGRLYTGFNLAAWITTYAGEGSGRTWTGNTRGYSYSTGFTGLTNILDNQLVTVTLSGCDFVNQNGENHTGNLTYSFTVSGFDKVPPYLTAAIYQFVTYSGAGDASVDLTAGEVRSNDSATVSGWLLWTSGYVNLLTTGNETTQITTGTITGTLLSYIPQTLPLLASDIYSVFKTIIFSGNYISGTYLFVDNPPYSGMQGVNTGYTYTTGGTDYVHQFKFDVFWIDRTAPDVLTASQADTPAAGYTTLILTGQLTGYTGSFKDDEFIVIGYSGVTAAPVQYATGYSSGTFSLFHTGIIFTGFWEGCVRVRDRAGNQVCVYVNIAINNRDMLIKALPEQRVQLFNFSGDMRFWSGDLASVTGDNASNSGEIRFNENGTGIFRVTLPASGGNYLVLVKGHGYLSHGLTGLFNQNTTGFDFTTGNAPFDWIKVFGVPNIASLYPGDRTLIVWGDVASGANDIVNSIDLATVNLHLTRDFTVEPEPLRVGGPEDNYVTAEEQAVIINNNLRQGFWRTYKSDTVNPWVFTGY